MTPVWSITDMGGNQTGTPGLTRDESDAGLALIAADYVLAAEFEDQVSNIRM
jgi:hypothetical protein